MFQAKFNEKIPFCGIYSDIMIRFVAIFFVVFGALSLWAAPAAAHGGHDHGAGVQTHTSASVQESQHSKNNQLSDRTSVLSKHAQTIISVPTADRNTTNVFVSSRDNHNGDGDPCCCNTGGSMCSPASAALLVSPYIKHPVTAPAKLRLSWAEMGAGRDTVPTLQPPKLIA